MPDNGKTYSAVHGFVQFNRVDTFNTKNNKTGRRIAVRAAGSQKIVNVTLWDDQWKHVELTPNDLITADGESSTTESVKEGRPVTYNNLSAKKLSVNCKVQVPTEGERAPVNQSDDATPANAPF